MSFSFFFGLLGEIMYKLTIFGVVWFLLFFCVQLLHQRFVFRKFPQVHTDLLVIVLHYLAVNLRSKSFNPTKYVQFCLDSFYERFEHQGVYLMWMFNRPVVVIYKPEFIQKVLGNTKNLQRGQEYEPLRDWLGDGLLLSKGIKWKSRRRILTRAFHFRQLETNFVPQFEQETRHLVTQLLLLSDRNGGLLQNLTPVMHQYALQTACRTLMGVKINPQHVDCERFLRAVVRLGNLLIFRSIGTSLGLNYAFQHSLYGLAYEKHKQRFHQLIKQIIEHKLNDDKKLETEAVTERLVMSLADEKESESSLINLLLQEMNSDSQIVENLEGVTEELRLFLFASLDTTATTASYLLHLLALHPDIQQKAYEEICDVLGPDPDMSIDPKALSRLPYVSACIRETLRLYSPAPLISRTLTCDLQLTPDLVIPRNTSIFVDILHLHQNSQTYPEPEKFLPERFLVHHSTSHQPFPLIPPWSFIPFSAGSRNCLGQRSAMESLQVLVTLLRYVQLLPVDSYRVSHSLGLVIKPDKEISIRFCRRNPPLTS